MDQFNQSFQCQACKVCFENSSQLLLHVKYHVSFRSFKCMLCDQFHRRYSPYDRLRQNNRYVGCVHRNNVDFNHRNNEQSCQKVTRVRQYAQEISIEDLDLENMNLSELRAIKEMLGEMLAQAEDYEMQNQ